MFLFIGENGVTLVHLFFVVIGLVVIGGISDHLHYNEGSSGLNFIAFMLIFLFTYYQITALRRQNQGEVPRLNRLMILWNCFSLFYSKGYRHPLLTAIRITIGFLQYHNIHLIISVMTYFEWRRSKSYSEILSFVLIIPFEVSRKIALVPGRANCGKHDESDFLHFFSSLLIKSSASVNSMQSSVR